MKAKNKSLVLTSAVFSLGLGILICSLLITADRFSSDMLAKQHHHQIMMTHVHKK